MVIYMLVVFVPSWLLKLISGGFAFSVSLWPCCFCWVALGFVCVRSCVLCGICLLGLLGCFWF